MPEKAINTEEEKREEGEKKKRGRKAIYTEEEKRLYSATNGIRSFMRNYI